MSEIGESFQALKEVMQERKARLCVNCPALNWLRLNCHETTLSFAPSAKCALGVELLVSSYKKTKGFTRPPAKIVFVGDACRVEIAKYVFFQL